MITLIITNEDVWLLLRSLYIIPTSSICSCCTVDSTTFSEWLALDTLAYSTREEKCIRERHKPLGLYTLRPYRTRGAAQPLEISWLQTQLFYSQRCYFIRLHFRAVTLQKLWQVKGHNEVFATWLQCLRFASTITVCLYTQRSCNMEITFDFFFSPRMPSCSISLLARALSDTNTIGWHVGNGSGW